MPFALVSILSMLVVLGIMVLVHETGHFLAAKLFGVRVEVFSIGFGTRLFGFRRGDTDYRVSLLPLGGYVKMTGETTPETRAEGTGEVHPGDPGDFNSKPRWQRICIGLAGPVSNFILAFGLMTGLYMMHNEVDAYLNEPAVIDFVAQGSAAAKAGLKAGDHIVQFDREHNPTWQQVAIRMGINGNGTVPMTVARPSGETTVQLPVAGVISKDGLDPTALGFEPSIQAQPLTVREVEPGYPLARAGVKAGDVLASLNGQVLHSVSSVAAYLKENGDHPVDVEVKRGTQTLHFNIQPVIGDNGAGEKGYRIGFRPQPPPFVVEQQPFSQAARRSFHYNVQSSGQIVEVMRRLFSRHSNVKQLSGPVGIARATGEATLMPGWQPIINLMAMISLNLGIFNLLPFPLLDGGMILLLLIETVMRQDLNVEVKERIYQVAFVVLILFFVFVTFNDVSRIAGFSKS
ncbi:RIP metalloprotease RseP [Acidipila sp. EB88]|uniref:RIP metalloprotease RseP n=1 Tax=Acidipila sp. EB88 TaxID=2305226 RepID=UPI000F5E6298|nr:RIP metalloprotease RseP [Acidipila sp. EB88]RRA48964.1 RIP metalloprotease RseP [Acidipila sp. EB88]